MTLICKEEFVNWSDREDREGTCASYTKKKDQGPAQRMNQLGMGLGLQGNILTWWMGRCKI
jgi:hypothetical protein